MNSCVFVGRLVKDVELQTSTAGKPWAKFALAVQENKDKCNFFDFVVFGQKAEFLAEYFTKGKPVSVTSQARQEEWEDSEGQKRRAVRFVVDNINFVPGSANEEKGDKPEKSEKPAKAKKEKVGASASDAGDDIPF